MNYKTKFLIGLLVFLLIIAVCAIGGLIYGFTPGENVNFDTIHQYEGKKVTIQGILGPKLRFVTVWDGDVADYYGVFSFQPVEGDQGAKAIELQFKPSQYPDTEEGDHITVTGIVGLDGRGDVYVRAIRIRKVTTQAAEAA